jgi:type IV pilus assembly protein PilN
MIRINLLPARAAKKKETARQQLSILTLTVIGVAVIVLAVYSVTLAKVSTAKDNLSSSEQELQRLKAKIGEIDNIKKLQEEVKKKLDVLNRLRKEKAGPANRLARLSDAVPEKVWLTRYTESDEKVAISGLAFNEDLIAEFIRNLLASKEFGDVELLVSEQMEAGGIKAKRFDLNCNITSLKKEKEEQPKPQKK